MRFCTMTLGCKVNQYETRAIERVLRECGHELVTSGEGSDVCIINTCAVTAESVRKSRQAIRRMKKLEPGAKIAVYGCYSQLEPDEIASIGADIINGIIDRHGDVFLPPGNTTKRTRALLKIQDGCDNFCAYCIVPYTRGRSHSLPPECITEYAKQLEKEGYKEIAITGIEISSYGKDLAEEEEPSPSPDPPLIKALKTINNAAPKARLRLGSLDPAAMTDGFCKKLKEIPNICNHFHLSLQSGCDETLRRMGRKYNTSKVEQAISSLRNHFEDCAITADLITGFPGETEDEFRQTLKFIKKANFAEMHIFPFSPRPGTKAESMPGQIEKSVRKERAREATEEAKRMAFDFKKAQIGKTVEVLFEQEKNGCSIGHSSNYLEIYVKEKTDKNSVHNVRIIGIKNDLIMGEII